MPISIKAQPVDTNDPHFVPSAILVTGSKRMYIQRWTVSHGNRNSLITEGQSVLTRVDHFLTERILAPSIYTNSGIDDQHCGNHVQESLLRLWSLTVDFSPSQQSMNLNPV